MTTRHTPGPWIIFPDENKLIVYCDDQAGSAIADCRLTSGYFISQEQKEANARLIAAAPDLLAAAQQALDCIQEHDIANQSVISDLINSIQKATKP